VITALVLVPVINAFIAGFNCKEIGAMSLTVSNAYYRLKDQGKLFLSTSSLLR